MSQNPINLTVRFLLECYGLYALGYWGWTQHDGLLKILFSIGLPLVAAAIWGIFRAKEDHGKGLIPVNGRVRLLIEIGFFSAASIALFISHQQQSAVLFMIILIAHYAVSYDRVLMLMGYKK